MNSYDVLVIILSIALAISLMISIIAGVYIIKVLKQINRLVNQTEEIAKNIGSAASIIKNITAPAVAAKAVVSFFQNLATSKTKKAGKK